MLDFGKNVVVKEEDMQKNLNIAAKRIFMCVAVFCVPTVVRLLINVIEDSSDGLNLSYSNCFNNSTLSSIETFENIEKTERQQKEKEKQDKLNNNSSEDKNDVNSAGHIVSSKSNNNSNVDDNASSDTSGNKIIEEAKKYYKRIENDGDWVHKSEKKKYKHKSGHETTCCYLISDILESAGYLKKGTLCHLNGSGSKVPSGYKNLNSEKLDIIPKSKISSLKKGDVIVYQGSNKSGNIAIYDHKKDDKVYVYGASSTNEIRAKSHPSAKMSNYWKNKSGKIIIIRAKK